MERRKEERGGTVWCALVWDIWDAAGEAGAQGSTSSRARLSEPEGAGSIHCSKGTVHPVPQTFAFATLATLISSRSPAHLSLSLLDPPLAEPFCSLKTLFIQTPGRSSPAAPLSSPSAPPLSGSRPFIFHPVQGCGGAPDTGIRGAWHRVALWQSVLREQVRDSRGCLPFPTTCGWGPGPG